MQESHYTAAGSDAAVDQVAPEGIDSAAESVYNELHQLNQKYETLESKEKQLMHALDQLRKDELCLQSGLDTLLDRQPSKSSKSREEEAIRRLQEALMNDSSSDDDDASNKSQVEAVL